MPTEMFLMVLGAALVHATWNALVKTDRDRLALIRVMSLTQLVLSLCLVPFVTVPAPESWPYLAASTVLCAAYMLFLNRAYQVADLSLVYPLARGAAPFIVAVVSVITGGTGVLAYLAAWMIIPGEGENASIAQDILGKKQNA